ncbi:MAG: isoprenylcysteine carboxylmethyltransferase family protein [Gammaproteobacteria bacterium]|nr:isoprenylcysteine carboxylmethyltransferase family protein [Gammaproteobacteria bacterium]
MKKLSVLLYGIINYNLGSAALVYLIAFTFNLFVPFSIDSGEAGNAYLAGVINLGLIMLFGLQHSIMARPAFKKRLARYLPQAAERSTFMLGAAVVTFALCLLWQPMPHVLWQADNVMLYNTLLAIGLGGWALVFYATFLINHFDLFGLRQVWLYFTGKEYTHLPFKLNSLYRYVRHPIMSGVFIGIWFTPVMTAGHLLLAIGMSTYIIIGVYHEEKDLIRVFGERYLKYIRSTGKFVPSLLKSNRIDTTLSTEV